MILAVITTSPHKVAGGVTFVCENNEEMQRIAANLEAILDGIAHALSDDLLIIVKH
ncbi:hypothetical protein LR68_00616 [Anoxybacillus sp. BCO1]|nr:hypothetical protein LR68_00616 [Anoxybacillus sp. BCO1]